MCAQTMRLSTPVEVLQDHYEVVVVGSGYGGGIAASRLARAGREICLLERGKEFQPGEYPNSALSGAREMQFDLPRWHIGSRTGLYDFRVNNDISVVLGCGLGGTSLINANISLPAEPRVFDDRRWPEDLRGKPEVLAPFYALANEMLRPSPYPEDYPTLPKLEALELSANHLQQQQNLYRPPLNVNFQEFENGTNHVGVSQQPCKLCGDCVSGCNYSAKNTTLMNYLPDAHNHGAKIFTQVSVRYLERKEERWLVHCELLGMGRNGTKRAEIVISADLVILAAGTLGSTEILLRSARRGLSLSGALGSNFTGNGDFLAFGYNNDVPVNGVGFGHLPFQRMVEKCGPVGPCIAGIVDMRHQPELDTGLVIQEGTIPGALSIGLPLVFAAVAAVSGKGSERRTPKRKTSKHELSEEATETSRTQSSSGADLIKNKKREIKREFKSLLRGAYHGAIRHTQTYLVMSHDDSAGRMYLDPDTDRLRIDWKGVGSQPAFERINGLLEKATEATAGTYVKNPAGTDVFGRKIVTVHPLGGCAMADDAERGVVNHKGQVFAGLSGDAAHPNLYVCDGSVIPRSLGVNPLLTISALAERSIALLAKERGWTLDYRAPA
jgi:cholesterol oxidase